MLRILASSVDHLQDLNFAVRHPVNDDVVWVRNDFPRPGHSSCAKHVRVLGSGNYRLLDTITKIAGSARVIFRNVGDDLSEILTGTV